MKTIDGELVVIAGKSRSGKTIHTAQRIKKHPRAIVYDPEDQWGALPGFRRITSRAELVAAVQKSGAAKLAFVPSGDLKAAFDFWAGCAFYWGRYHGACAAVAEEIADVTTSSKAPGNWGILLRRGLKRGITIFAISQRWAEADKTALGNATEFVCFAMLPMDQDYMAKRTGIPADELATLRSSGEGEQFLKEFFQMQVSSSKKNRNKIILR